MAELSFIRFGPFQRWRRRMNDISGRLINKLAGTLHELRPDWDEPGIVDSLSKAKALTACTDGQALALAAVRAAGDQANRTPKVIALDGQHWRAPSGKPTTEAYYGPTATFCPHEIADEDDGRTRKCLMVLIPDEACTHHRPRRSDTARVVIDQARVDLAAAQGAIERSEGDEQALREAAKETVTHG